MWQYPALPRNGNLWYFGAAFNPLVAIEVTFCPAKRTHVLVGPAEFCVNQCNESPLRGEIPYFWPVSKFNTGSLPHRGILPVTRNKCITSKEMQYRQNIVTRVPITRVELITISIVTIASIWHNSVAYFLRFSIISVANLQILWRQLPM